MGVGQELRICKTYGRTDGQSHRIACLQKKKNNYSKHKHPLFAPWNNDLGEDEEAIDL